MIKQKQKQAAPKAVTAAKEVTAKAVKVNKPEGKATGKAEGPPKGKNMVSVLADIRRRKDPLNYAMPKVAPPAESKKK